MFDNRCGGFDATAIRCRDVSPSVFFQPFSGNRQHSVSGRMLALAVAADGKRLYAGSFSGVWRSDDAGATWIQMTAPQPPAGTNVVPGALAVPDIVDVIVSPLDRDVVFAATAADRRLPSNSKEGVYKSTDGGVSWRLVHQFACSGYPAGSPVGQVVFAPDNPSILFAAGNCKVGTSRDGGETWADHPIAGQVWHVAAAPAEYSRRRSIRRVYAAGPNQMWYSIDGGSTWWRDKSAQMPSSFGDIASQCCSNSSVVLAVEPRQPSRVYLAVPAFANGPSYYQPAWAGPDGTRCNTGSRMCGEGSLWFGNYGNFLPGSSAIWTQLPGPPAYVWGSTDSGNVWVQVKTTPAGYYLFFSDRSHIHVSDGKPETSAAWHRLDGRDASQGLCERCFGSDENGGQGCNLLFVHADPHAFAVSSDFSFALGSPTCPAGPFAFPTPFPYNQNSILHGFERGSLWMANDGGVYSSIDGGAIWTQGRALATLQPQASFAGISVAGKSPALYMGVPDNDNFYSPDGGTTWKDPITGCGDCGPWFADPAQPNRVLEFDRGPSWSVYTNPAGGYPDPLDISQAKLNITLPTGSVINGNANELVTAGTRPIIQTPLSESPLDDGDYVAIRTRTDGRRELLRTTALSAITSASDWDSSKALRQGPIFPAEMNGVSIVQAAGGHNATFFYVGDGNGLWRWTSGAMAWVRVVPAADSSAATAQRFFADPYDANRIYIVDHGVVKRSENMGTTWFRDDSLDTLASEGHTFSDGVPDVNIDSIVGGGMVRDMIFDRVERTVRFAVGDAGIFYTTNGVTWMRLLSTTAMAGHPVAAYFDRISDPSVRTLYVAVNGRGILAFSPIPKP